MPALTAIRRSKLASAAFLGLLGVSSLVYSPIAQAQVAEGIGFVAKLAGATPVGPLLECASFALNIYNANNDREQGKILKDIAGKIDDLAGKQDKILAALADQRIVMREELRKAFLDNDCRELQAVAHHFKIALANGPEKANETELNALRGRADELSTRLSLYGVAGVPAYVNAIALQNALHMAVHSSPETFAVINEKHAQNMEAMLKGDGVDTVFGLAKATFDVDFMIEREQKAELGSRSDLRILHDFNKEYPLSLVQVYYQPESNWQSLTITVPPQSTLIFGYKYKGVKNGTTILEGYLKDSEKGTLAEYSQMKYASDHNERISVRPGNREGPSRSSVLRGAFFVTDINGIFSSDSVRIPELESKENWLGNFEVGIYETTKNAEDRYIIPEKAKPTISRQYTAISNYYERLHSRRMGEVSAEHDFQTFRRESPGCHEITRMLEEGLKAVRTMEKITPHQEPLGATVSGP